MSCGGGRTCEQTGAPCKSNLPTIFADWLPPFVL
jgi:hypothetical protein